MTSDNIKLMEYFRGRRSDRGTDVLAPLKKEDEMTDFRSRARNVQHEPGTPVTLHSEGTV